MTEEELDELISDCPTLFHMAERGAWGSIQDRGLLSTSALLDLTGIGEREREAIEAEHRAESIEISTEGLSPAVIRDQIPMDDAGLRRCLPNHMSPSDWYRILNSKVFFWLTKKRLHRLTGAKAYRDKVHDIIEVDTRSLIEAYREQIWFCPINSGCTKPMPRARDESTFARIRDYPYSHWRSRRSRGERVVELAVDHSVPDLVLHTKRVVVMQGTEEQAVLFERSC